MPDKKLTIKPKLPKGPRGEDGYKVFSIRIRNETVAGLEDISAKTGRTRNELIGTLLEYALENCEIVEDR